MCQQQCLNLINHFLSERQLLHMPLDNYFTAGKVSHQFNPCRILEIKILINLTQRGCAINVDIKVLSSPHNMEKCVASLGYRCMAIVRRVRLPDPREYLFPHFRILCSELP